jgi:hypothetical protein
MQSAMAAAATLVALAFSMATFERWLSRRRPHELVWSVALALFTAGAASLWLGAANGWNGATFRAFYLFGAIVNVPVLALGTVYLLGGKRRGNFWAAVVALGSAFAAGVLVVAPLEAPIPPDRLPRGSEVFGPLPRVLAAVASSVGALVVLGGAALSAWRLARTRRRDEPSDARPSAPRRLVAANLLIAGGTLVLGAGGLFNSVLDEMEAFAVTLVLGIALIFGGFLVATAPGGPRPATGARPDSEPARSAGRRSRAKFDRSPSPSS